MKPLADCRLYTFIDSAYLNGRTPEAIATALCKGGSDIIQLRAKDWSTDHIAEAAASLMKVVSDFGVRLVINDHVDIAHECEAHVCHLGQEDFFDAGHHHISELQTNGRDIEIGLSTHAPDQAQLAIDAGADYVAIGPIYPTGTKPTAKPVTLDYVRWAAANVKVPWFAIGGINLTNISDVLRAGATRICVVSAILNAPDIEETCKAFRKHLPS